VAEEGRIGDKFDPDLPHHEALSERGMEFA
jgi:hypothetical protein